MIGTFSVNPGDNIEIVDDEPLMITGKRRVQV